MNIEKSTLRLLAEVGLPLSIQAINFQRLKFKYTKSSEATMSVKQWDEAELAYRRFLTLKLIYPTLSLMPTRQADEIWRAHILDTRAYRDDCYAVFGYVLDHYPYHGINGSDDTARLHAAFVETEKLYEKHFGTKVAGAMNKNFFLLVSAMHSLKLQSLQE